MTHAETLRNGEKHSPFLKKLYNSTVVAIFECYHGQLPRDLVVLDVALLHHLLSLLNLVLHKVDPYRKKQKRNFYQNTNKKNSISSWASYL